MIFKCQSLKLHIAKEMQDEVHMHTRNLLRKKLETLILCS